MFKLGKPTLGAENDCFGIRFILKDYLIEGTLTPDIQTHLPVNALEDNQCSSSTSHNPAEYFSVRKNQIDSCIQTISDLTKMNEICPTDSIGLQGDSGNVEMEVNLLLKNSHSTANENINEWQSAQHFQDT